MSSIRVNSRWMVAMLVAGLIALAASLLLVFASATRLSDYRQQQTTATEYALTLTRLASAVAVRNESADAGLFQSDQIARLVAMGDVQSSGLKPLSRSGFFNGPQLDRQRSGTTLITRQWTIIRNSLAALNSASVDVNVKTRIEAARNSMPEIKLSLGAVFDAVTKDTLSVPLLRNVSQLSADLANLAFILNLRNAGEFVDSINNQLDQLRSKAAELQLLTVKDTGSSLLGYESNLLLRDFVSELSQLQPVLHASDSSNGKSAGVNHAPIQQQILNAIDQIDAYRRMLDGAIHYYRRAILGALACMCAAMLFSALLLLRMWRMKKNTPSSVPSIYNALIDDVNKLADGNLSTTVRSDSGDSEHADNTRQIAHAVNYTVDILRSLIEVARRVAGKTAAVARKQRGLTDELMQADWNRQQFIVSIVETLKHRSNVISAVCDSGSVMESENSTNSVNSQQIANRSNAALAEVSAQVELGSTRIKRAVDTMSELSIMVDTIKVAAENSNLRALNSSIQMSVYSDGGDMDGSSQFVDEIQSITQKLVAGASDALRLIDVIKTDLHAANLSMAGCTFIISENVENSISADPDNVSRTISALQESNTQLTQALTIDTEELQQIAEDLCDVHEIGVENKKLPALTETTLDLLQMAEKLENSLSRYNLGQDQAVV